MNIFPTSTHLVKVRYWPLVGSITGLGLTRRAVYWWHGGPSIWFTFKFLFLLLVMISWWSDIFLENKLGYHTGSVLNLLRFGMIMFILSEIMFFFSFFWAYFHSCLGPATNHGLVWPPVEFNRVVVDSFSIPLLNTLLLVSSGARVTWTHASLIVREKYEFHIVSSLVITILLGFLFLLLQGFEYANSLFALNSMTYGSCFFLLTGFHGLHVTVGAIMLRVCLFHILTDYWYNNEDMVGFECARWYWHFVDVVWLFLFIFVYLLFGGSN